MTLRKLTALLIAAFLWQTVTTAETTETPKVPTPETEQRLQWFKDAKFGMMLCWGLYSIPEGLYEDGSKVKGYGEWFLWKSLKENKGTLEQYNNYMNNFRGDNYDAELIVKEAKEAGMKYIVVLAKHHDGFCLWPSEYTDYDIERTPFYKDFDLNRDPMMELKNACKDAGLQFILYYSHVKDWHEFNAWPGGDAASLGMYEKLFPQELWDKDGDGIRDEVIQKDHNQYLNQVAIPQIQELCDKYAPDGFWFDMPLDMSSGHKMFTDAIRDRLPDCIINSRVRWKGGIHDFDFNLFDFVSFKDNAAQSLIDSPFYGEMPLSVQKDTYSFTQQSDFRSTQQLMEQLISGVNSNYNVLVAYGLRAQGDIPKDGQSTLNGLGQWFDIFSESVHGTRSAPSTLATAINSESSRPAMSYKGNKLYVFQKLDDLANPQSFKWLSKTNRPVNAYSMKRKYVMGADDVNRLQSYDETSGEIVIQPKNHGDAATAFLFYYVTVIEFEHAINPVDTDALSVTFTSDWRGKLTGNTQQGLYPGDAANAPVVTPVKGWSFTGWDMAFDNVTEDITVKALYTPNNPKLNVIKLDNIDGSWKLIDLVSSLQITDEINEGEAEEGYELEQYFNPVIVATPIYQIGQAPVVVRIRNVSSTQFEIKVQRADKLNTPAPTVSVTCLFAEAGVYNEAEHGITMEAAIVESTNTDFKNSWVGQAATMSNTYTKPAIFGQVMTSNSADLSVFWSMGADRKQLPSNTAFNIGKHYGELSGMDVGNETLGYIIAESNFYTLNNLELQFGRTSDSIEGYGEGVFSYPATGDLAVTTLMAMNGNDGGWAVLCDAPGPVNMLLPLAIDEDLNDNERDHTTETVAFVTVSRPIATLSYDAGQDNDGDATWENLNNLSNFDFELSNTSRATETSSFASITHSYRFNGTSSGKTASLSDISGNPSTNSATFEAWVKPSSITGSDTQVIFETGGNGDGIGLFISGARASFIMKDDTYDTTLTSEAVLSSNEFNHIVGVYEKTDTGRVNLTLYVNGIIAATQENVSGLYDWAGGDDTGIGNINNTCCLSTATPFHGAISSVRFYQRALVSGEVKNIFDSAK